MVTIKEVKTRKDLRTFAGFNEKMYRDVPQAMPDLISDEMANFNPKKNPAFEYAESRQWLAYKDGECVGRIGAIISHKANAKWDRKRSSKKVQRLQKMRILPNLPIREYKSYTMI